MLRKNYYKILHKHKTTDKSEIFETFSECAVKLHPDHEVSEKHNDCDEHEYRCSKKVSNAMQYESRLDEQKEIFENIISINAKTQSPDEKKTNSPYLKHFVTVKLEDVIAGTDVKINVKKNEVCNICNGKGNNVESLKCSCPKCKGLGQVQYNDGFLKVTSICSKCCGTGILKPEACEKCNGSGILSIDSVVNVIIPKGITSGTELVVKRKDISGHDVHINDDIIVVVNVKPHDFFRREENNLYSELSISFLHAILGHEVTLNLLKYKTIKIKVPAFTQHGDIIRLKGCGICTADAINKGDLYLKVFVVIPKKLSIDQRLLMAECAKSMG
jgi:molecular chaperone DnaJ